MSLSVPIIALLLVNPSPDARGLSNRHPLEPTAQGSWRHTSSDTIVFSVTVNHASFLRKWLPTGSPWLALTRAG